VFFVYERLGDDAGEVAGHAAFVAQGFVDECCLEEGLEDKLSECMGMWTTNEVWQSFELA
jgi:hypothetical protein